MFVIAVGGLGYLVLHLVVSRLMGVALPPLVSVSASIIVAVIAWTALIWIAGERLGGRATGPPGDERDAAHPSHDVRPDEEKED